MISFVLLKSTPCFRLTMSHPILLLYSSAFFSIVQAVGTTVPCPADPCDAASLPTTGNDRVLGNRVSPDFKGFVDVRSNDEGTVFSADMQVSQGAAWPRITEGVTIPGMRTPGYPIPLDEYFTNDKLHIKYRGEWRKRTLGPPSNTSATGQLLNGVQIYLNDPKNKNEATNVPIWPFTVEVVIWNRYDDLSYDLNPVCNYTDADGNYTVVSGRVARGPNIFLLSYKVINRSNRKYSSANIDTIKLFRTLVTSCKLPQELEIIDVSVLAQGIGAGTDASIFEGGFVA